jgi:uncharacterized protein with HEPN domain
MRQDGERLQDILEAIGQIERYALRGKDAFQTDELVQIWMGHHLQVIGEATAAISEDLQARHPEVPWASIIAFRNVLVHEYFRIDLETVWRILEQDLPGLKLSVASILQAGS